MGSPCRVTMAACLESATSATTPLVLRCRSRMLTVLIGGPLAFPENVRQVYVHSAPTSSPGISWRSSSNASRSSCGAAGSSLCRCRRFGSTALHEVTQLRRETAEQEDHRDIGDPTYTRFYE